MALLYLGTSPVNYTFEDEYYLSPVVTPNDILAKFPKTFFITGEKDPLVDDTVVFAGRLRQSKEKARKEWIRRNREKGFDDSLSVKSDNSSRKVICYYFIIKLVLRLILEKEQRKKR